MGTPSMTQPSPPATRSIRVIIQQPVLTHYRVPVFRELARRPGIDLTVLYGDEAGISNAPPDGFRAEFVKLHDLYLGRTLVRWHGAQILAATPRRADVVVLSWSIRYLSLLPALVRARWHDMGIVLWGHGYSKTETSFRRRSRNFFTNLADSALLYNYRAAQSLIDDGAMAAARTFIALNTIDLAPVHAAAGRWRSDPRALARFRFEHGLDAGPVVLFVSRLLEPNRVDVLVRATPLLARRFPDLRVVIVGDGPDRPRLERIAEEVGAREHLRFTGAVYGEDNVAPWFLSADVFCYPANIGLSLIHAMGYGLPVVTGDLIEAHNPEIEALRDGINGFFFRHADPDSLAEVLGRLLADPALRRRMGEAARDTVTNDFSIEKMVDGMEAAIRVAAVRHGR
jgi:glycosyltransferase involved in cell wall biosynthesis